MVLEQIIPVTRNDNGSSSADPQALEDELPGMVNDHGSLPPVTRSLPGNHR